MGKMKIFTYCLIILVCASLITSPHDKYNMKFENTNQEMSKLVARGLKSLTEGSGNDNRNGQGQRNGNPQGNKKQPNKSTPQEIGKGNKKNPSNNKQNPQKTNKKPSNSNELYKQGGRDWPGVCKSGKKQSPINIRFGTNTKPDKSQVEFNYKVPKSPEAYKFYYNGIGLSLDIKLGDITFYSASGSIDIYDAYKITLNLPSEHYVTMSRQTPRFPIELRIFHTLRKSDNYDEAYKKMQAKVAVVAILFNVGPVNEGNFFFNFFGINNFNKLFSDKFNVAEKDSRIDNIRLLPATYGPGMSTTTLESLLNIIGSDQHLFFYYGSETIPPCTEDRLWMVFARPRSISKNQYLFLEYQIAKSKSGNSKDQGFSSESSGNNNSKAEAVGGLGKFQDQANKEESEEEQENSSNNSAQKKSGGPAAGLSQKTSKNLFGNKREIQPYDDNFRGKVLSNKQGIRLVKGAAFFNEELEEIKTI